MHRGWGCLGTCIGGWGCSLTLNKSLEDILMCILFVDVCARNFPNMHAPDTHGLHVASPQAFPSVLKPIITSAAATRHAVGHGNFEQSSHLVEDFLSPSPPKAGANMEPL